MAEPADLTLKEIGRSWSTTAIKKLVAGEANRLGLIYGAMKGKTQGFDGSSAVCITLRQCVPNPKYDDLTKFCRARGIVLTTYVDGVSG